MTDSSPKTSAHIIPSCPTEYKLLNNRNSTRGKHWDEEEKNVFFKGLVNLLLLFVACAPF